MWGTPIKIIPESLDDVLVICTKLGFSFLRFIAFCFLQILFSSID